MSETKVIKKRHVTLIAGGVIALVLAIGIGGNSFEDVPIGKYQVKQQWLTGNKSAKMDPGVWPQFGTIFEFPTQETYFGTAAGDKDADGDTDTDMTETVRFADGYEAKISFTARVTMPQTEDDAISLVEKNYRSYNDVQQKLLRPVFRKALRATANMMTAKDSYSEKRNEFTQLARDQITNGPFVTRTEERTFKDELSGEMVTRPFTVVVTDTLGNPLYQDNTLADKYILIDNFEVKDFDYQGKVDEQIATQADAMMQVATAKAEAMKAEQEKIKIAAQGAAEVERIRYDNLKIKEAAVIEAQMNKEVQETDANRDLEVARLAKLAAQETKEKEILLGQGEAERKRLNMTGAALNDKLIAAAIQMNKDNADALARRSVPSTYFAGSAGGTGGSGGSYDDEMIMQLRMQNLQLLKSLGLDMNIKKSNN